MVNKEKGGLSMKIRKETRPSTVNKYLISSLCKYNKTRFFWLAPENLSEYVHTLCFLISCIEEKKERKKHYYAYTQV